MTTGSSRLIARANASTTSLFLSNQPSRIADLKIVLVGESSVGKSSIVQRFQNNTFSEGRSSTIGAAFISKKILREASSSSSPSGGTSLINMQIWDTAGQERFHNLTPLYYRNANVAMVIFDLTDSSSFQKAEYWISELKEYMDDSDEGSGHKKMKIILIGNKLDLLSRKEDHDGGKLRADSFEDCSFIDQIDKFLDSHEVIIDRFFKTSAKLNIGISELFNYIIDNVDEGLYHSYEDEERGRGVVDLRKRGSKDGGCQC
ncbi:DEKNAAC102103 [Brettanomyces naardenensis]|uniref:DEKNAAC102103 n=1 Tax=Brettanomyces naardenensis TaxID=13370 RepID=A0A448YJR1_BRENA|nr:DEKNAAC102103 [Brettanomyces naardenensis]